MFARFQAWLRALPQGYPPAHSIPGRISTLRGFDVDRPLAAPADRICGDSNAMSMMLQHRGGCLHRYGYPSRANVSASSPTPGRLGIKSRATGSPRCLNAIATSSCTTPSRQRRCRHTNHPRRFPVRSPYREHCRKTGAVLSKSLLAVSRSSNRPSIHQYLRAMTERAHAAKARSAASGLRGSWRNARPSSGRFRRDAACASDHVRPTGEPKAFCPNRSMICTVLSDRDAARLFAHNRPIRPSCAFPANA